MAEGGIVRRAVFAEGVLVVDANGESPPRDPQRYLGSTALAAETGQIAPISQSVDLPPGLPPEARNQAAA
jgi:hypothetical protein